MRVVYSIFILLLSYSNINAQTFNLNDSVFNKGDAHRTYNVNFELGQWDIRPESYAYLDSVVSFLIQNPNLILEIQVHGDARCCPAWSSRLVEQRRAMSISDYFISKGIHRYRFLPKGYGNSMPTTYYSVDNQTNDTLSIILLTEKYINQFRQSNRQKYEQFHQLNRRVEFVIFSTKYVPPPLPIDFKYEVIYGDEDSLALTVNCEIYNNTIDTIYFESQSCNGLQDYLVYDSSIVGRDFINCNLSIPLKMCITPNSKYTFSSNLFSKAIVKKVSLDLRFVQLIEDKEKISILIGEQLKLP